MTTFFATGPLVGILFEVLRIVIKTAWNYTKTSLKCEIILHYPYNPKSRGNS